MCIRDSHSLVWNGRNVAAEFEKRLAANGFLPTTVRDAPIEPGERLPAFCVRGDTADRLHPDDRCLYDILVQQGKLLGFRFEDSVAVTADLWDDEDIAVGAS